MVRSSSVNVASEASAGASRSYANGSPPLLDVRNLQVEFTRGKSVVYALRGLSYSLRPGETLGIVGESGSGKSAGVLALLRLLPPTARVTGGEALFDGTDLLTLTRRPLNDVRGGKIGIVYQDPLSALNPVLTIGRQITEVIARHKGVSRRDAQKRAIELLDVVGISGGAKRLSEYPGQLSGGMRQRVTIAMAISCDPKLLIADEPTTALDVTVQAQILELLSELRREIGMAMIIITHDMGIIAGVADRVVVMYAGQAVEEGPADAVLDDPRMPYTLGLLRSVPRMDLPRNRALASIPGSPPDLTRIAPGCSFAPRCAFRIDRCAKESPSLEAIGSARRMRCWVDVKTSEAKP
jgi:oligopeptide transport system ATP-binding protein